MLKKIFLIFALILLPLPVVFALEVDWPPSPLGTDLTDASTLTDLTKYLYEWGIALGGLAAFIALLIAGFMYLTSVGDPQKMADARGRIIWALAGLVLLLASWLVLNTINPDLTALNLDELSPPCDTANECPDPTKYVCTDKSPGDGKKEGICIFEYTTKCNTVNDCPEPKTDYKCTDKNPNNAEKEGVCIEKGKPACSYAIVSSQKNFTGVFQTIDIDDTKSFAARSVKSFYNDASIADKICAGLAEPTCKANTNCDWNVSDASCYRDCGQDACGCSLVLYDVPTTCWYNLGISNGYAMDLSQFQDRSSVTTDGLPDCVELKASTP